jgi:hypothetical protein
MTRCGHQVAALIWPFCRQLRFLNASIAAIIAPIDVLA